ncbi:MAG: DNA/RNA nuclease SfsA [Oscillospiraceae bacterium]|nr:DNA/RNA nuclease SfsA [Oscillospiraceae bacterium]
MIYNNIFSAKFLSRPNRFIANIEIDGKTEVAHVKNTGRCKELLVEGATVFVQQSDNPNRKTKYDLISVLKGDRMINMDSQIPNKVFGQWAKDSGFFGDLTLMKPEKTYGNSRFDYYLETENDKIFVEVKGVTLENDGVVLFPDAPTERGVKHINELCQCVKDGYKAYIFFIIQMDNVKYFTPNRQTHPVFADALKTAAENGVGVYALDCKVTENSIEADKFVEVKL